MYASHCKNIIHASHRSCPEDERASKSADLTALSDLSEAISKRTIETLWETARKAAIAGTRRCAYATGVPAAGATVEAAAAGYDAPYVTPP